MKRKPSLPGREEQGDGVAAGAAAAASGACFTIDAARGLIVESNAAGWEAWGLVEAGGLEAAPAVLPIAVDRAMPAIQRLVELAGTCRKGAGISETLSFWTARGVRRWRCKVSRIKPANAAGPGLLRVTLLGAAEGSDERVGHGTVRGHSPAITDRLAHELRTPLSAVIAYAEILKDEHFGPMSSPAAQARYRDYARNIYDSARHALGVVDGMVGGSAGRADVPELAFRDLDPGTIVANCLSVARPLAAEAGLELDAEVGPDVPRIVADEVSLQQMLLNLLTNAIKFARPGDKVTVRVSYDAGGPLCIAVADTGRA
jgi:two-component system, cell cycle sensor histidine kinase PleC